MQVDKLFLKFSFSGQPLHFKNSFKVITEIHFWTYTLFEARVENFNEQAGVCISCDLSEVATFLL